jgi:hypothetical protein
MWTGLIGWKFTDLFQGPMKIKNDSSCYERPGLMNSIFGHWPGLEWLNDQWLIVIKQGNPLSQWPASIYWSSHWSTQSLMNSMFSSWRWHIPRQMTGNTNWSSRSQSLNLMPIYTSHEDGKKFDAFECYKWTKNPFSFQEFWFIPHG